MATLTITPIKTFVSGETVDPTKLNQLAQSTVALTAGTIVDADISAGAAIAAGKLASTLDLSSKTITLPDSNIGTSKIANAAVTAAKLDGAQTGSAPIYGCRAWVVFNGSRNVGDTGASTNGNPVKIIGSGNVTSVVKVSAGNFTVNFTTALPNTNYAVVLGADGLASLPQTSVTATKTTSAVRIVTAGSTTGTATDSAAGNVSVVVFA